MLIYVKLILFQLCYDFYMKELKDFEKILNKCSKCGLCQTSCPLFNLLQNECAVSKGKFIMLHGVTKGDLKLSKNINKYIDMCLKCGKCKEFCPSGIDVCTILNIAKHQYMKKTFMGRIINFLQSRLIFSTLIKLGAILSKPFRPKKNKKNIKTLKLVYFKGCVNQICPRTDNYIHKIFKDLPVEIIEPDFDCCGIPFLSEGNLERFEQAARYNLGQLNIDYDYLITDCASCESTILSYQNYFEISQDLELERKSINWGNLIAFENIKFKFDKPLKVTFHKPCHLKNDKFLNKIFSNCENVEYVQMPAYDDCCGFSGTFAIKNCELSKKLSVNKAKNIELTGADYVITTCPACIMGLNHGLFLTKNRKIKVISLLEFLSMADEVIYKL